MLTASSNFVSHHIGQKRNRIIAKLFLLSILVMFHAVSKAADDETYGLDFNFTTQGAIEDILIEKAKNQGVFSRLKKFTADNFKFKRNIVFHFRDHALHPPNINKDDASTEHRVDIPFSFLYQLNQGLQLNYPQQLEVQEIIYGAVVEKLLWFELGKILIDEYELTIAGEAVFAMDNFSTLMLLNQDHTNSDYLLDATEAFLLIQQTIPNVDDDSYEQEVKLDDERYRKAVCLILGKDFDLKLQETKETYIKLLDELTWDRKRIELCQALYLEKMALWLEALNPHLKEASSIQTWLAASR